MKITKQQLKQIIKEELERVLENAPDPEFSARAQEGHPYRHASPTEQCRRDKLRYDEIMEPSKDLSPWLQWNEGQGLYDMGPDRYGSAETTRQPRAPEPAPAGETEWSSMDCEELINRRKLTLFDIGERGMGGHLFGRFTPSDDESNKKLAGIESAMKEKGCKEKS